MEKHPHVGHRQRLKDKFLRNGFDNLPPHEIMEFLLMYSVPQGDVNPLAHRLIDKFGSLHGVVDATYEELMKVDGVGSHTATYLIMLQRFVKAYMLDYQAKPRGFAGTDDIIEYLKPYFIGKKEENVYAVYLDSSFNLLACEQLAKGTFHSVAIQPALLLPTISRVSATGIVLAHNHLSDLIPSTQDIIATQTFIKALKPFDIKIHDHIIFCKNKAFSLVKGGYLHMNLG